MADNVEYTHEHEHAHFSIGHLIIRVIVGAIVLGITALLTPGFAIASLWSLLIASLVLAIIDYLVTRVLGVSATPFGRGISGFIMAAIIIYVTALIVPGFRVTLLGAVLGALVYGLVDMIIPGKAM